MATPRMGPPRDPTLDHQVILEVHHNVVVVSCNCRGRTPRFGTMVYDPIGQVHNSNDTKRLYNNPEAHRKEFVFADMLSFPDVKEPS